MKILHHYDGNHLPSSAKEVVPLIIELLKPRSVVDVGCGLAQWLYVFNLNGVKTILGIDGNHVPLNELYIPKDNFLEYDLERAIEFRYDVKFDLAISLEVAERISEKGSDGFIKMLTELSNSVLFSAAIPYQTGERHINEQPHNYWQEKFREQGFEMLDILRPIIWNNKNVNWWYRQNIFLCVKKDHYLFDETKIFDGRQLIHPELLNMYVSKSNIISGIQTIAPTNFIHRILRAFKRE
jgi:hypothetical protein